MDFLGELTITSGLFLAIALLIAFSFEFVNGFHDTANAVATVIYTNALKPGVAVVLSGFMNLLGVLTSTGTVAFSIISLLPVELVIRAGSVKGFVMVFALLLSAIIWNVGTWYFGIPASSSHTLIGAIIGVGIANSLVVERVFGEGVNWAQAEEVGISLLISPIIGFLLAAGLLLIGKMVLKTPKLYLAPEGKTPPPLWIRALLILTCTGVSFAHGSNDGQKGMGLVMLILVGILPGIYALNLELDPSILSKVSVASSSAMVVIDKHIPSNAISDFTNSEEPIFIELSRFLKTDEITDKTFPALAAENQRVINTLSGKSGLQELSIDDRTALRTNIYLLSKSIAQLDTMNQFKEAEKKVLLDYKKLLDQLTDFIPFWVQVAVALSLGLGTMIGWKKIVVTVGEKIGKEQMTYAQGASAQFVAMSTILAADHYGLPVSTTHVLSSGVAGTMTANGSGLQMETIKSILLAWVLTLPACILLGGGLFAVGFYIVGG